MVLTRKLQKIFCVKMKQKIIFDSENKKKLYRSSQLPIHINFCLIILSLIWSHEFGHKIIEVSKIMKNCLKFQSSEKYPKYM